MPLRGFQFNSRLYHVGEGQVFLPALQFSPVSIVPLMLRTDLHPNTALIRRTSGRSLRTFKQVRFVCRAVLDRKLLVLLTQSGVSKVVTQTKFGISL